MERVGIRLKKARENKDITLREASQVTKIGIRFLKALENDEYDIFPSQIYLRSFLRNYASFLGMDEKELTGGFMPSQPIPLGKSSLPERHPNELTKKVIGIFVVMISIWILWVIYQTVVVKF